MMARGDPLRHYSVTIYALCDPDGTPRYVGATMGLKLRFQQHLSNGRRLAGYRDPSFGHPRDRWLYALLGRGERPVLKRLERVPIDRVREREVRWIKWFIDEGYPLMNRQPRHLCLPDWRVHQVLSDPQEESRRVNAGSVTR